MTQTRWTTLAALLLAALLLTGCGGGGGGDGVKQDLEAQLEALMAERNAARQAQQTAEAAQTAAEEAQTAAEEAQAVAETTRQAAETARAAAEAERDTAQAAELAAKAVEAQAVADLAEAQAAEMTAKAAQKAAEAARATAEEARATADAARKAAEAARATAETERDAAKAAQAEAVAAQAEAEAAQAESVAAEMEAKAAQTVAEAARDAAVKAKTAAEAARDESRDGETQAKIDLIAAQSAQALAERRRDKAEAAKTEAEQARAAAETARQEAEAAKTAAETARDTANTAKAAAEAKLAEALQSKTTTEADLATVRQQLAAANTSLATANANLQTATQNLATANAELTRVKADLEETNDKLDDAREARRQAELAQVRAEAALAEARRQRDQAEEDTQDAQQEVQRVTRQVDVNARAQGLLTALEAVYDTDPASEAADLYTDDWRASGNPASAGINTRQTDIELTASPLTGSTRRSGNFYTATLMRTAPGVNQPERKTVVYTDREKTRTFANHYATSIDSEVGGTTSNPRFVSSNWVGDLLSLSIVSNPSRGGHPSTIAADPGTNPDPRPVSSLSARVRGVSGNYGCYNKGASEACDVMVTATYAQEDGTSTTSLELATLTIAAESNGTLYFDPGSGTISLLNVEKPGAPAVTDEQYITFGWWQERPALVDGTYQAVVFATSTGIYSGAIGSAEYEGPAVGLYVDRTSEGGTTIYESGDFTATAILRATFDEGNVGVEGDVSGFRTTHGAKNWVVSLDRVGTAGVDGTAEIVQPGTGSTGAWEHSFLARPETLRLAGDNQPIAVTGRFDVSIPNVRHIVGAFGAHRTTAPIGQ